MGRNVKARAITRISFREMAMNNIVTLGLVLLLVLGFAIDVGFAVIAIERLAQSDIQVIPVTDLPIRF